MKEKKDEFESLKELKASQDSDLKAKLASLKEDLENRKSGHEIAEKAAETRENELLEENSKLEAESQGLKVKNGVMAKLLQDLEDKLQASEDKTTKMAEEGDSK